jgi:glycosyltransferase involved in cell wall biosynthesis
MSEQPLRILYHHRIAAADGMRVHVNELVSALEAQGHVVRVVGPTAEAGEAGATSRLEGLAEAFRRWLPSAVYEGLELVYNVPAYLRLSAAARAFRPDVLYERYNLFLLAGLVLKRRLGVPMLLEVNAPLADERAAFGGLALRDLARRCEAALWRGADAVLPVTEVLARQVRAVRGGGRGVHVAPNGAEPRRPDPAAALRVRARLGLPKDAVVLGFVGFVRAWHGLVWAVEVLPRLPQAHLVVVGDGPGLADLEALARRLGVVDRVRLLGRVPHGEVTAHAAAFDIALQPAATAYASPLKLFEYMALGKAIVAPDQPNLREVLADGRDALLFAPGSQPAFARALERLCGDAALRAALGAGALRRLTQAPFTWTRNAERVAGLGRELARLRRANPQASPRLATSVG